MLESAALAISRYNALWDNVRIFKILITFNVENPQKL